MPNDTKTALLDCAENAARTRGIDGFSYADLAKDVGIRKASIHHHFATKAALSVALMARYTANVKAVCSDIDDRATTGAARLADLVSFYREALSDGKSLCLCVSFSANRESLPVEVIAKISAFRQMMIDWLASVFTQGIADGTIRHATHANAEAAATLSLLEGAQLAARAEENIALFDRAVTLLLQRTTPR